MLTPNMRYAELHEAVDDQAKASTFHGYMPEGGATFLRKAIAGYYAGMGANVDESEIFVSSGACDDLGDILELFDQNNTVMVIEPAYPEYVDTNILGGRKIIHVASSEKNGFLPEPEDSLKADILYICSPNNPTGAVFNRIQLQAWIDFSLMLPMRFLLRMQTCLTAFMNWMALIRVPLRSAPCPRQQVLLVRDLDIQLCQKILFETA